MPLENTADVENNDTVAEEAAPASATPSNLFELIEAGESAAKSESDNDDNAPPSDSNNTGDGEKKTLTMFNDLAEAAGMTLDDLYKLRVTTGEGETVTIEDLKALQSKQDDIVIRELEFEENRTTKEGLLRQSQNELSEIVSALPEGTLNPQVLEKLRTKNNQRTAREQQLTLDAIPSWSDEKVREADIKGMAEHLTQFGYPADYLSGVVDHRQWLFVRESFRREQRIKSALSRVRAGTPNPTTPTRNTGTPPKAGGHTRRVSNARNSLQSFFSDAE